MTFMELVEIISTILIFGSGLLLIVVIVSFFISKAKEEIPDPLRYYKPVAKSNVGKQILNFEQQMMREKQSTPTPKIFQLDQFKSKEVKKIRKISSSERLSDERYYAEEISKSKTRPTRYTIVNDQIKKSSNRAMNFYF